MPSRESPAFCCLYTLILYIHGMYNVNTCKVCWDAYIIDVFSVLIWQLVMNILDVALLSTSCIMAAHSSPRQGRSS